MVAEEIKNTGSIVIVIDIPGFSETTMYELSGVIVYENRKLQQTPFPQLHLDVQDITNDSLAVKKADLIKGRTESLLAILAAYEETRLFVNLPDTHGRMVDSILEIDCLFRRMEVVSSMQYYAAEDASRSFEGLIMRVTNDERMENKKYFSVFSR